jgi:FkbM family methyltransferase
LNLMRFVHRYINQQPRVRDGLTRLIYGNKDTDIELFMRKVRVNSLLENGYYRASRLAARSNTLRHESIILQRINLFIRDKMTVLDIGSNIGLFSICLADIRNLYADFDLAAFEVNPDTFSRLSVNAERYRFTAHNVALASDERELEFVSGAVSGVTTTVENATAYNIASRSFKSRTRRIDSFDFKGDLFMKIDVEGQEMDILQGASRFFEEGRVAAVYIDGFDENSGIADYLAGHGMTLLSPLTLKPYKRGDYYLLACKK